MEIVQQLNGKELTLIIKGELNSVTAPQLEDVISKTIRNVEVLIFDMTDLEYLSSAGLRVLLVAQKVMAKQGKMILRHVNNSVIDIFVMTGFINILTIEN